MCARLLSPVTHAHSRSSLYANVNGFVAQPTPALNWDAPEAVPCFVGSGAGAPFSSTLCLKDAP